MSTMALVRPVMYLVIPYRNRLLRNTLATLTDGTVDDELTSTVKT